MGEVFVILRSYLSTWTKVSRSQRGVGLVGVMIAAALVVIIALAVSNFIVDQTRLSKKLEISGSCQNIANSLVEFIKKDEASLFITSYGANPSTINFPAGADQTEDGIDRFAFGGPIPVYAGNPAMTIATGDSASAALPATISYHNHLNIKNSTNRLIALAFTGDYCAGARYFDNFNNGDGTLPRPGFTITEKDVEVDLQVDFEGIACVNRLTLAQLPTSTQGTTANFDIDVVIKRGQPDQQSCRATGVVSRTRDTSSALTLLEYETDLCAAGSTGYPAQCGASAPVNILVRTIKNNATCQNSCAGNVNSVACSTVDGGGTDLFDTDCPADCQISEPGSMFLCKIGEKNWFAGADNFWEPCESARVRDFDGTVTPAVVTIRYLPTGSAEQNANARITLTNLPTNRSYVVNVRSVDTAGNIGPAFCSATGSRSCDDGSPPHFTVINGPVNLGAITETTNYVNNAGQPIGRDPNFSTLPAKYSNALSSFGANKFQCDSGAPNYRAPYTFNPAVPAGAYIPTAICTASLTSPGGGVTSSPCTCANGICDAALASLSTRGNYSLSMAVNTDCGAATPIAPPQNWCLDNVTTLGATYANSFSLNASANFTSAVTEPTIAVKACGVTSLCPNLDGTFTKTLGSCGSPADWLPMAHSGCTQDPRSNYCAIMFDPCGRQQQTTRLPAAPPTALMYDTVLAGVPHTSASPAANECFEYPLFPGIRVGGNLCETAAYCSRLGKCLTSCVAKNCPGGLDAECDDPSYGVTSAQPGGPRCGAGNRCTCPTNKTTPSANDCAKVYCPILNSCNLGMAPTLPAGPACIPCSNWVIGPESACVSGTKTRAVTCPTACCIGPKPWETTTCPDCTFNGVTVLNGNTVRAYLNVTEPCGGTCTWEDSLCTNGSLSSSYTNSTCAVGGCSGYSWYTGGWSPCQNGVRTRSVYCRDDGTFASVPDSNCGGTKPASSDSSVCALPIDGECGYQNGGTFSVPPSGSGACEAGTASPNPSGAGPWNWICTGVNAGGNSSACSANQAIACAPTIGSPGAPVITEITICTKRAGSIYSDPSTPINWATLAMGATTIQGDWVCLKASGAYNLQIGTQNGNPNTNGQGAARGRIVSTWNGTTYIAEGHAYGSPGGAPWGCSTKTWNTAAVGCSGEPGFIYPTTTIPPAYQFRIQARPDSQASVHLEDAPCGPVVGVCGPANGGTTPAAPSGALNLCSSGTPSAVTGSGPWAWTCEYDTLCGSEKTTVIDPLCTSGVSNVAPVFIPFTPLVASTLPGACSNGFEHSGNFQTGVLFNAQSIAAGGSTSVRTVEIDFGTYTAADSMMVTAINASNVRNLRFAQCNVRTHTGPYMGLERPPDDRIRQMKFTIPAGTVKLEFDFLGSKTPHYAQIMGLCDFNLTPLPFERTDSFLRLIPGGPVPPHWEVGAWTVCTAGVKTRSVRCFDSSGSLVADALCSPPKPSDTDAVACGGSGTNGVCGPADNSITSTPPSGAANLCSAGTPTSLTGSDPWEWQCTGSNGGTSALCGAGSSGGGSSGGGGGGSSCFIAGTQITLSSGKNKAIEDIQIGDVVRTYDEVARQYIDRPVEEALHYDEKLSTLYTFSYGNASVTSNDVHRFYLPREGRYMTAKEIYKRFMNKEVIHLLMEKNKEIQIVDIQLEQKKVRLYNLHVYGKYNEGQVTSDPKYVDENHNYFANGVLVHNMKPTMDQY